VHGERCGRCLSPSRCISQYKLFCLSVKGKPLSCIFAADLITPSIKGPHWAALISVSVAPSQTSLQLVLQDHGHGASESRGVSVYFPAATGTHFTDRGGMDG